MDDQQRRENAERIRRQLNEGSVPLEDIFPTVQRPPQPEALILPPVATFVAKDIPSPHGGTLQRQYLVDCPHGTNELTLQEPLPTDSEVLGNMMRALWSRTGCACPPIGWAAA